MNNILSLQRSENKLYWIYSLKNKFCSHWCTDFSRCIHFQAPTTEMYLSKALHYQFLWPHSYLNCFDQPICQLFAMTARLASQQSCQTQLAAQGLSVLTQCWILQLQLLALLNEVWSCRLFSQYIAPSVTSSPVFLYCENRSLVSSVFIDHTLLFDDAVPWSDLSLLVL